MRLLNRDTPKKGVSTSVNGPPPSPPRSLSSDQASDFTEAPESSTSSRSSFFWFHDEKFLSLSTKGSGEGDEFSRLHRHLRKFVSRRGAPAANILRLSLLPFLRRQSSLILPPANEVASRLVVLEAWWIKLLADLRADNMAGGDRNAFYEAISGLMSRPEWLVASSAQYSRLMIATMEFALHKVSGGTAIPIALAAFTGKVLAYCFFFVPGVSSQLLWLLRVPQKTIDRLSTHIDAEGEPVYDSESIPEHLLPLVGLKSEISHPPCGSDDTRFATLHDGSWIRHWQPDSVVFASFFKHYCSLVSQICVPMDSQVALNRCAPGWILVLSSIVNFLDWIVRHSNSNGRRRSGPVDAIIPGLTNSVASNRGASDLRLFKVFREVLHNDVQCLIYFDSFVKQFDAAFRCVSANVNVYHADACVKMCDMVEEWMHSITLEHPKTRDQAGTNSISWDWWLLVVQRMLSSNNCYTEIRALTMVFNLWPTFTDAAEENVTGWVLNTATWQKLFCHWSPLVRSYYHRLLCYRLTARAESKDLLRQKLLITYKRCAGLASLARVPPEAAPSLPLPKCQVTIIPLLSSAFDTSRAQTRTYLFDVFDNAVYWCAPNQDWTEKHQSLPISADKSSEPEQEERRRWSSLSLDNLRKFFKTDKSVPPTPSKTPSDENLVRRKRPGSFLPLPQVLCEPQPEIEPPHHRFTLTPIQSTLPDQRRIAIPRLPDQKTPPDIPRVTSGTGSAENDLAHWNYGGRSLAEWNVAVSLYESFTNHQRSISEDGKIRMPLLVAEIPWRAMG